LVHSADVPVNIPKKELQPEALYKSCKPGDFKFETTAELHSEVEILSF